MAYATRANIEDIFGIENVQKWADLNHDGVDATIAARITTALDFADDYMNDRLRGGPYTIPFKTPFLGSVVGNAATLAGVWLYESRGVVDFDPETGMPQHRLQWQKKSVDKWLHDLKVGKLRLSLTDTMVSTHTPEAYVHEFPT